MSLTTLTTTLTIPPPPNTHKPTSSPTSSGGSKPPPPGGGQGGPGSSSSSAGAPSISGSGHDPKIGGPLTLTITHQVNILIFSLIALFILLRLPHLFGFLRSIQGSKSNSNSRSGTKSGSGSPGRPVLQTLRKASPAAPSSAYHYQRRRELSASSSQPTHSKSSSSFERRHSGANPSNWVTFDGGSDSKTLSAPSDIYHGPEKIRFHETGLEEAPSVTYSYTRNSNSNSNTNNYSGGGGSGGGGNSPTTTPTTSNIIPPRIISVPTFLEPLTTLLRSRVPFPAGGGYSAMQIAVLANYTYILLYGAFRLSNPFTDPTRTARLAVSQLPLIFALAQKASILGSLLGYGYERLNYIHRYAGRLAVLGANIHALHHISKWLNAGSFKTNIARPRNTSGFVTLIALDLLFFFSLECWRRKAYRVFRFSHTIGVLILFPAAYTHRPALQPYILTSLSLYLLDRLLRLLLKSHLTTASLTSTGPHLSMACLTLPHLPAGWRAGQHVRLRVLSSAMGSVVGWAEAHPFTIASAPSGRGGEGEEGDGEGDGVVLLCKNAGDWTRRLVELASKLEECSTSDWKGEGSSSSSSDHSPGGKVRVCIEGPYGGPSRMVFTSYSAAVLIVGGSGITFGLAMVDEIVGRATRGESRLRYVELVWVVPDPSATRALISVLTSLFHKSTRAGNTNSKLTLRISMYYTRALRHAPALFDDADNAALPAYTPVAVNHPNITLSPGRPDLKKTLNDAICGAIGGPDATSAYDDEKRNGSRSSLRHRGACGLAVGICGPESLGASVVNAVCEIDSATRYRVGGVEVHEETFGW